MDLKALQRIVDAGESETVEFKKSTAQLSRAGEWGRGTQMIVDLCVRAGHPDPEFVEQTGAVGVRFLPSGYIAPHRIVHDLTQRQREILQLIARDQPIPLRDIMKRLANPPAAATVRDDLYHLKRIGLLDSRGRGRGAVWLLRQEGLK
ncbi:MAG: hypothetical protein GF330_08745 [Candidatus Eisenbacteria bacterium]|nr:hypothetical protein [Candidatus Eisenbacteria bacterium]